MQWARKVIFTTLLSKCTFYYVTSRYATSGELKRILDAPNCLTEHDWRRDKTLGILQQWLNYS